ATRCASQTLRGARRPRALLAAGAADDDIDGRGGADTILAGAGNDLIHLGMPTAAGHPIVEGGAGDDFIALTATTGADSLVVQAGTGADVEIVGVQSLRANSVENLVI